MEYFPEMFLHKPNTALDPQCLEPALGQGRTSSTCGCGHVGVAPLAIVVVATMAIFVTMAF